MNQASQQLFPEHEDQIVSGDDDASFSMARRDALLRMFWTAGSLGAAALGLPGLARAQATSFDFSTIGALASANADGIRLPAGFTSRVVAVVARACGIDQPDHRL